MPRLLAAASVTRRGLIVFGAGAGGRHLIRALGRRRLAALVDNDAAKWGTRVAGVRVSPPSAIDPAYGGQILIATVHAADVYEQLLDMGVPAARIAIATPEMMKGSLRPSRMCAGVLAGVSLLILTAVLAGG